MERTRAEAAVRASEGRFRAVANLVPDLLWESRPGGFSTWHNGRWLAYTGQTAEQALGWGWTEALHPEDRAEVARRAQQAGQAGGPLRQEYRIRRHDGAYRWFVVNAFPLPDEQDGVVRVYVAATDIHHLREHSAVLEARVEERTRQLAELNAELQLRTRALEAFAALTRSLASHLNPYALIRLGQDVALSLLPDGYATYYEPVGSQWLLRAQAGEMRSSALQAAVNSGLQQGQVPSLDQPWTSGEPLFQDQYAPDADGLGALEHGTNAVATLPLTVDGRQVGVFAVALFGARLWSGADRAALETVVRNLGLALERAGAVQALAEEREALAAFVRFTELTADTGDVDTLARHAAEVLRAVLGVRNAVYFEQEEGRWKVRYASGALAPEFEPELRRGLPGSALSFALVTERREPMFFEPWDAAADGLPVAEVYRAAARYPLFPQDHPVGVLGMAMTERAAWTEREKAVFRAVGDSFRLALERVAQVQQLERQRERLADLNAELGNLITRTAHTLEAPARRLGQLLESEQVLDHLPLQDADRLGDEVLRLRGVAADLRQLAQLEQQAVHKELLPLGEVFAAVQADVAATPRGERLQWRVGPLPIVRGDRALLRQALEVLMTFTLSETRGARTVTVESREVDGEVHVTVTDDGLGLTGEEAATLFDLSVRTDQRVPVLEGSGLIQMRRILARHGGWVWAEAQHSGKVVMAFPRDEAVNELEALFRQDRPGQ
ncbi:PAS domain-containing protein [Deinococcus multiflagellatus]|uniref:histidine kinase n=2 Tax=Deinococcus multiflagellatus TaxID=1656887 RepID=A0ABW1ZST8_9DEIO